MSLTARIVAVLEKGDATLLDILETLHAEKPAWFLTLRVSLIVAHLDAAGVLVAYNDYRFSAQRAGRPRIYYRFNTPRAHLDVLRNGQPIGACGALSVEAPAFDTWIHDVQRVTCPNCRARALSAGLLSKGAAS